jgi:transposase
MEKDVAAFLGVHPRTVSRWVTAHRQGGDDAIKAKPTPGRPPKLTKQQERSVQSWLAKSPKAFGYQTDLWTTRRLVEVIERRFGVKFNANYLAKRLTKRDYRPQKPVTQAVEGDNPVIARWVSEDWPRIQKKRARSEPTSS